MFAVRLGNAAAARAYLRNAELQNLVSGITSAPDVRAAVDCDLRRRRARDTRHRRAAAEGIEGDRLAPRMDTAPRDTRPQPVPEAAHRTRRIWHRMVGMILCNSTRKPITDAIKGGSLVKQEKLEKLAQHSRQIHFYILSLAFLLLLAVTSPGGRNLESALAQIEHLQKAVKNWNAKFALVALGENPYSENLKWTQTHISNPLGNGKPIPALKIEWPRICNSE